VGHPVWDRLAKHQLSKEGIAAFKAGANVLEVATGNRKFTIADPVLDIELTDGRRIRLMTGDPTQSTPPDWVQGQGRRVESEGLMRWEFP